MSNYLLNMKIYLVILVTVFLGCSVSGRKHEVDYVKIFTIGRTDSVNDYNKGLALGWFLSYDFNTDSAILRSTANTEPVIIKTYAGKFKHKVYGDTLINAIKFLKKFPEGSIRMKDSTAMYSGPEFFMEFKDGEGIHFYNFILEGDLPLEDLSNFFSHVKELDWAKKTVNNNIINSDKEAVTAALKAGFYNEMYPHYVSGICGEGINLNKLYGTWRISGHKYTHTYNKVEFTKEGNYYYERINKDTSDYKFFAKYTLDEKQKEIILNKDGSLKKLRILKLTEDCLEYEYVKEKIKVYHNRLK